MREMRMSNTASSSGIPMGCPPCRCRSSRTCLVLSLSIVATCLPLTKSIIFRWFCGSSQQPNPQQQPLHISPALFHLFSQKRDQFYSPAFDPVMSPDFGSPPQRSLDIFVLLLWRIVQSAGRPSAICFICAHSSSEIGVKRA